MDRTEQIKWLRDNACTYLDCRSDDCNHKRAIADLLEFDAREALPKPEIVQLGVVEQACEAARRLERERIAALLEHALWGQRHEDGTLTVGQIKRHCARICGNPDSEENQK